MIRALSKTAAWIFRGLIKFYQLFIGPLFPNTCRFYPSCSRYAMEALRRKPLFEALRLISKRLAKCQPLHPGGYDPVP